MAESDTDGWTLNDINCEGGDVDGISVDTSVESGTVAVSFDLPDNDYETVICTFMNEQNETPTPTATATGTATATATPTVTTTSTPVAVATSTPTKTPTPQPISGSINPPNTGSAGLKH